MKISDFYRLELHWDYVDKVSSDSCALKGAFLTGPTLSHAAPINSNDHIILDLTPQYTRLITSYYFVKLAWGSVKYDRDLVFLDRAFIDGVCLNTISTFSNSDYILIDTSKHDGEMHMYNMVYKAYVVNREGEKH